MNALRFCGSLLGHRVAICAIPPWVPAGVIDDWRRAFLGFLFLWGIFRSGNLGQIVVGQF